LVIEQTETEARDAAAPAAESRDVLNVRDLSVFYGATQAIDKVNLDVPANQIVALIGPSGCGKSTLIRAMNRMNELLPGCRTEGAVFFNGANIYSSRVDPTIVRFNIGMVFQRPNPFPKSIYDNVAFGLRINGIKKNLDEAVETSLRRAALWDEVKDRLKENGLSLSGGQQQRLCIARALAVNPEIVLMDEPASALDPISTQHIEDLLLELKREISIVIVTHNMQQAARISDFVAVMMTEANRVGKMIEYGSNSDIFGNPQDKRTEAYVTGRIG